MRDRVDVFEHLQTVWGTFWALEGDRLSGFGATPTPFLALDAFAQRCGLDDPDDMDRLRALIRKMDQVYCEHHNKAKP